MSQAIYDATRQDCERIDVIGQSNVTALLKQRHLHEGAIPAKGAFANPEQRAQKVEEVEVLLENLRRDLNVSDSTPLGSRRSRVEGLAMELDMQLDQLRQWLRGRVIDGRSLREQLEVIGQDELIARVCVGGGYAARRTEDVLGWKPTMPAMLWDAFRYQVVSKGDVVREILSDRLRPFKKWPCALSV
jgi:hypothetical protein